MGLLHRIFGLGRDAAAPDPDSSIVESEPGAEASVNGAQPADEEQQSEPVLELDSDDSGDFGDLMAELGATPVSAEEAALAIRDSTIRELRSNLARLRPLGDQLAETEKARLGLESQLAEQHVELAHTLEQHYAQVVKAEALLRKTEAGRERAEDRLRRLRGKFGQRDKVARERWHKIRGLQQDLKALRAELESFTAMEIASPSEVATGGKARPCLAQLFDPNPDHGAEVSTPAALKAPVTAAQPRSD